MNLHKHTFMLNKMIKDITASHYRYPIADDVHSSRLGEYYFVFSEERVAAGKDQALIKKFDDNGIPLNKTYIDVTDKEYVYFPISIGQMGLSVFHSYLNGNSKDDLRKFMKFVEWFYVHGEHHPKLGVRWLTDVSLPAYNNPGPWQSAFSQSRGISILLRGYQLTGKTNYARMAEDALLPFTIPVADGGVASIVEWGKFYEEYTAEYPTLVLNGHIFALFGIYDFLRVFPDNKICRTIWEEGVLSLKNALPHFDMGWWTKYNDCRSPHYADIDPATIKYQNLHITQLQVMHKITGDNIFQQFAEKWEKQLTFLNKFRSYLVKYKALKKIGRL